MKSKTFLIKVKHKIKPFHKIIKVDSDKSLSIRSFLIGSICQNISTVTNVLESEDVKSTIEACKKLGVKIVRSCSGSYKIYGKGLGSLFAKKNTIINCFNSGTLSRLLLGILSTTPNIEVIITGDSSLRKRSMKKLIQLMSEFGATFLPKNKFNFPLKIISTDMPLGINYSAGISAQLKSAVILAGLNSYGNTKIIEKAISRDHTENLLKKNTKAINIKYGKEKIIEVYGKKNLEQIRLNVAGDPSSAAFFTALTLLNKNSFLKIKNVGLNPTRIGYYKLLKNHKAKIKFINVKKDNNEFKGDILIKSCKLKPIFSPTNFYPSTADEFPILFVLAGLTKGISVFKGISDLMNKESNRIKEMQKVLKQVGIKTISSKNDLKIYGEGMVDASNKTIIIQKGIHDHRIHMASFVLALLTGSKTRLKGFDTVFTSSPSFLKIMKLLGAKFEIQK
tara:strand:- start:19 stop:1368 length:1350 start_codon:yes stop_codon:yes gene_type:complete